MIDQKICFIIPAFNEQNTISEVIYKIQDYGDIIVVDDCSTDKTKEILSKLKVINVRHNNNLGYDLSLNTGFKKAYELNMNFAITIYIFLLVTLIKSFILVKRNFFILIYYD